MNRPRPLARRLSAIEKQRDTRHLMHAHRLTDGRTVRLSSLDMLDALHDGLALDGEHVTEPPSGLVRTMALLDPEADPSMMGRLMLGVAAEWCAAYDEERPVALRTDKGEGANA
ncbi:hypothetical protein ACIBL5_14805 [Streptomyces sp. NPDC050516]|uniref:hypothetical protein n=1 Tax=Streptomyces sp. NPDC050516 TaxID=3365621 RepID=UPI0037BAFEDB